MAAVDEMSGCEPSPSTPHPRHRRTPEQVGLSSAALAFLVLRAFSSGCTALTGAGAISNGVPAFRKPKAHNAAMTMTAMGAISITMFSGVTALALISRTRVTENTCDLIFSNGIILLAVVAGALIYAFDGSATRLIQLYIVGVFTSFTLCQVGMVRHWNRELAAVTDPVDRRRIHRARAINAFGACFTGVVLAVVMVTKFTHGAYLVVFAIPVLVALMFGIHRHYAAVRAELHIDADTAETLPSRVHAVVLVSGWHKATQRAVQFARATRPDTLTAVTVNVDDSDTRLLHQDWDRSGVIIPLVVIESPYREVTRPVLDYIKRLRRDQPRDVVSVYIPEYVVGRWWENLLHNQSSLRLKARLLFEPGVMVTSVPWQLRSSKARTPPRDEHRPGQIRKGITGSV